MTVKFDDLERQARALSARDKAKLARTLIDDLDAVVDEGAEQIWLEEAQRRYRAYSTGMMEAASGEEAMQRARLRLKAFAYPPPA